MRFFLEFFKGIGHCFRGFALLFEKGLWPYLFFPLAAYALLSIAGIFAFSGLASYISGKLYLALHINRIADSGDALSFAKPFLSGYFSLLISLILRVVFWFISGTFLKYMSLIVLSPLFSLLSASVEKKLNSRAYPFHAGQFIRDIFRGIGISLRNMLLEYLFIFAAFVLSLFFPPLAFITLPFTLLVSWYYFGFTMLDYNFERHGMSLSQSVSFTRAHRGLACGIGIVYAFFISLPGFIGAIAGMMFGPVLAILGATTSFLEIKHPATNPV